MRVLKLFFSYTYNEINEEKKCIGSNFSHASRDYRTGPDTHQVVMKPPRVILISEAVWPNGGTDSITLSITICATRLLPRVSSQVFSRLYFNIYVTLLQDLGRCLFGLDPMSFAREMKEDGDQIPLATINPHN